MRNLIKSFNIYNPHIQSKIVQKPLVKSFNIIKNGKEINTLKFYNSNGVLEQSKSTVRNLSDNSVKTITTTHNVTNGVDKSFRTEILVDGKLQSTRIHNFSRLNTENSFIHSKLETTPLLRGRYEKQTIETLGQKNKPRNFIYTEAYRARNGRTTLLDAASNVVSPDTIRNSRKLKFLPIHMYENADFAQSCLHLSHDIKSLNKTPILKFKKLPNICGGLNTPLGIFIDLRKFCDKTSLVNAVAHELHHSTQISIPKSIMAQFSSKHSFKIKKYLLEEGMSPFLNAPASIISNIGNLLKKVGLKKLGNSVYERGHNLYFNELIEKQARHAGEKVANNFDDMTKELTRIMGDVPITHFSQDGSFSGALAKSSYLNKDEAVTLYCSEIIHSVI